MGFFGSFVAPRPRAWDRWSVLFGDSSDGVLDVSAGTTTLAKDTSATNVTVAAGAILKTNGFRLYASGTLINNGTIHTNGTNGGDSTTGDAGLPGGGSSTWGVGTDNGSSTVLGGNNGGPIDNCLGIGNGGDGGAGSISPGGIGGVVTPTLAIHGTVRGGFTRLFGHLVANMNGVQLVNLDESGPGGAGGGSDFVNFGGGGGGGGGRCYIAAKYIINNGTISSNAGNGGNATLGDTGGGGGGSGGHVHILTKSYSGSGIVTATLGTFGVGHGTGTAGTNGHVGVILQGSI